jgi:hypothetical protein
MTKILRPSNLRSNLNKLHLLSRDIYPFSCIWSSLEKVVKLPEQRTRKDQADKTRHLPESQVFLGVIAVNHLKLGSRSSKILKRKDHICHRKRKIEEKSMRVSNNKMMIKMRFLVVVKIETSPKSNKLISTISKSMVKIKVNPKRVCKIKIKFSIIKIKRLKKLKRSPNLLNKDQMVYSKMKTRYLVSRNQPKKSR